MIAESGNPARTGRMSPRRLGSGLWRRATRPLGPSRRLSIEATFTLIGLLNGLVLLYLLAAALRQLAIAGGGDAAAVLTVLLTLLLAVLAGLSYLILRRRIVVPIRRLLREARLIHSDNPDGFFSIAGEDEISLLASGFNAVLARMRQALADLDASNRDLLTARRQIEGSLDYANILQRAILPDRDLRELFGSEHGLLWLPRDSVGGDWYLAHRQGQRALLGVADCAGHGVSGAMMTMLARAALDRAIEEGGLSSPAALLDRTDTVLRGLLGEADSSRVVATSMDLALVLVDLEARRLRFAGARLGLYWSDGQSVGHQRGAQRSIAESRAGQFEDHDLPWRPGTTYTLSTDGLLDQNGGSSGFSLGRERFERWLLELAPVEPARQQDLLRQWLREFQGEQPQRDDITLLCFRLPPNPAVAIAGGPDC